MHAEIKEDYNNYSLKTVVSNLLISGHQFPFLFDYNPLSPLTAAYWGNRIIRS